ncbi:DNA helicase RecQ [Herbivorax sp. ANBcel31]|uniref:DNA helicase RecQ n=1 Tax=Herbivorax sp. ANBcel31 TaxID=3069754 RepID=UPI0027ADC9F7|nr:DNA helicase RecQ [Herbivorax sp. ANBcel31]MDQ2086600.1 DNA helicase RecQ [Herbivorax sp. ANBcel31]
MHGDNIQILLNQYFGYETFKKGQKELIEPILNKQDVLGIMPTGAGKSICYQIPAMIFDGITLVISPLISLMKDQVDSLCQTGIKAAYINSSLSYSAVKKVIENAQKGLYKLIYVAPERLETEGFFKILKTVPISLIAVDEAHCVSQWGHDFRPSYTKISNMVGFLPSRPVLAAFTATATPKVKKDIIKLLNLSNPFLLTTSFDRKNLYLEVNRPKNKYDFLLNYIESNTNKSGVIYCSTRKTVELISKNLENEGVNCTKYHAGLSEKERTLNQEDFIYDRKEIMIATNAFGMGIDKPDIRFVIHYNMPKNMESYYQEAGRAGRDGSSSDCILLYGASDIVTNKFLIEKSGDMSDKTEDYKKLNDIINYCNTDNCIRNYILKYFGQKNNKDECENCSNCNNDIEKTDITIESQKIMSCIKRMNESFGSGLVADVLRGANTQKIRTTGFNTLSTYGIMKDHSKESIKEIISFLVAEKHLILEGDKYPVLKLNSTAYNILKGKETLFIKRVLQKHKATAQNSKTDLKLFEVLHSIRRTISQKQNIPPYMVFSDATLTDMCRKYPITRKDFLEISGVGEIKLEKYADDFLPVIKSYVSENNIHKSTISTSPSKPISITKDTRKVTYELHKKGHSIDEISQIRNLTPRTIENHLLDCVKMGFDVDSQNFVQLKFIPEVIEAIKNYGIQKLKPLKEALPDEVSYSTIKYAVIKYGNY